MRNDDLNDSRCKEIYVFNPLSCSAAKFGFSVLSIFEYNPGKTNNKFITS